MTVYDRDTLASRRHADDSRTYATQHDRSGETYVSRRPLDWDARQTVATRQQSYDTRSLATTRRDQDSYATERTLEWDEATRRTKQPAVYDTRSVATREPSVYDARSVRTRDTAGDSRSVVTRQRSMYDARSVRTRDAETIAPTRTMSYDDDRTRVQAARSLAPTSRTRDDATLMTRSPSTRGRDDLSVRSRVDDDARSTRTGRSRSASTRRAGGRDHDRDDPPPLPRDFAETIKTKGGNTMTPMSRGGGGGGGGSPKRDDRTLASRAPTQQRSDSRSVAPSRATTQQKSDSGSMAPTRKTSSDHTLKPKREMAPLAGSTSAGSGGPGYMALHKLRWCDLAHPEHEMWRQDALHKARVGDPIDRNGYYSNSSWLMYDIITEAHRNRRDRLFDMFRDVRHDMRKVLRELDHTSPGRKPMTLSVTKGRGGSYSYESAPGTQVYGGEPNDIIVVGMHADFTNGDEQDGRHLWFARIKAPKNNVLESEVRSHDKPSPTRDNDHEGPVQLPFTQAMLHYVDYFFEKPESGTCKLDIKMYHAHYLANAP